MTEQQKETAKQMALEVKPIAHVSKELAMSLGEVSEYMRSVDALSWKGAKMSITNRLNRLKRGRKTNPKGNSWWQRRLI